MLKGRKRGKILHLLKKTPKNPYYTHFQKNLSLLKKNTIEIVIKFRKQAKKLATGLKFVKKYLFKMKVVPFFLSPFSCSWIKSQLSHFPGTPCPLGNPEAVCESRFFPQHSQLDSFLPRRTLFLPRRRRKCPESHSFLSLKASPGHGCAHQAQEFLRRRY